MDKVDAIVSATRYVMSSLFIFDLRKWHAALARRRDFEHSTQRRLRT